MCVNPQKLHFNSYETERNGSFLLNRRFDMFTYKSMIFT